MPTARAVRKARKARDVWAMGTQLAGNETGENLRLAWSGMGEGAGDKKYSTRLAIHSALFVARRRRIVRPSWELDPTIRKDRATICLQHSLTLT